MATVFVLVSDCLERECVKAFSALGYVKIEAHEPSYLKPGTIIFQLSSPKFPESWHDKTINPIFMRDATEPDYPMILDWGGPTDPVVI